MLSPVRMEFTYQVVRHGRPVGGGLRPHRARRGRPVGSAVPAARADTAGLRMKALVTGAAGFIGSHLVGRAARPGRAGDRPGLLHRLLRAGDQGVEPRRTTADATGSGSSRRGFRMSTCHGARRRHRTCSTSPRRRACGKSWGRDFRIYTDNNVDASQQLLEACVGLPLQRFVYASSSSVYGDNAAIPMREDALPQPVSPYGVTKLAAEQLCHLYFVNHGVPAMSLRYFTVYGPRQRPDMAFHRFLRAAMNGEPITLYGDGEQTRDFTFVADAVAATMAAANAGVPGRAYNVGGGSRVSVNRGARNHRPDRRPPLDRAARTGAEGGHARHLRGHRACAGADLGFAPTVSLERGPRSGVSMACRLHRAGMRAVRFSDRPGWRALRARTVLAVFVLACAAACASGPKRPPAGTPEPDKFLFERGTEELNEKHWFTAREYFRTLIDSYPQSTYRADAKLGLGDTYLGEGSAESQRARHQRVPRVPVVLPHPPASRLRAVQARHVALLPDARPRSRSDRDARSDQ